MAETLQKQWGDRVIAGSAGIEGSRENTVDKKHMKDKDTIRKFKNNARLDFLCRKVWCLKSEVCCLI
jgi:hypothetical protein